jgi:hypothetical protein
MAWELTGNAIGSTGGFLGATDAQPLIIRTGINPSATPPERLRVAPDGKIGIGTATPQARLSVAGGGAVINSVTVGTDTSGVGYFNEHETVGVAVPGATLRLQSPNGLSFHAGPTGAALADNERMTITPDGNVGVGRAPGAAYRLDAAGVVNADDYHKNGVPLVGSQWADAAGGGISYTAGNVGVGMAPAATYKVDVAGTINAAEYHKNGAPLTTSQWANVSGGINYAGGNVGIGTTTLSRKLHVQGSEIHSGGTGGGYSFGNRETAAFVEGPGAGERWVWYASGGRARLWSGGDKLSVGIDGAISHVVVGPGANGRLKTRHIDGKHWLNDNDDALHLNWGTGKPVILGFGNGTKAALDVSGDIRAGNSDIYFTRTDHNHTGWGNAAGWAAIENAANYGALMILGRAGTARGRYVRLWDYLQVNGGMDVTGSLGVGTAGPAVKLHAVGNRIRIDNGGGRILDMRADGAALDLESNGADLYINNNNVPVRIRNLIQGSSRELKKDIADLTPGEAMEALENLNPVSFVWKDDEGRTPRVGFIAEETPEIARTTDETGVIPMHIVAILSRVVKEQQRAIAALRQQLEPGEAPGA